MFLLESSFNLVARTFVCISSLFAEILHVLVRLLLVRLILRVNDYVVNNFITKPRYIACINRIYLAIECFRLEIHGKLTQVSHYPIICFVRINQEQLG